MEQVEETVTDGYQPPAPHFSSQHLFHWRQCTQCPWVLSTLEFKYRLQFKSKPPQFQGIVPTVLREEMQYRSLKNEVSVLLEKLVITHLPSGSIGQGFYSTIFPDSKERWGSSSHPESQEVQSSFKASALPYALSFKPFNFHQTRGLFHNSGSPGCIFPHPNSQGPQ